MKHLSNAVMILKHSRASLGTAMFNVPYKYSANPSLGKWCGVMRYAYNQIQQGLTPKSNLTQDQIECLEEIGFKWKVSQDDILERFHDLEAFKSEFRHCNVPQKHSTNPSLERSCSAMGCSYNKIQRGQTLTPDQIEHLDEIGVYSKENLIDYGKTFEQCCHDREEGLMK